MSGSPCSPLSACGQVALRHPPTCNWKEAFGVGVPTQQRQTTSQQMGSDTDIVGGVSEAEVTEVVEPIVEEVQVDVRVRGSIEGIHQFGCK